MEFRLGCFLTFFTIYGSFNPCFSGYGIQTLPPEPSWWHSSMFQSLFFWIWNSDFLTRVLCPLSRFGFQSLFFWIWNSDFFSELSPNMCLQFQSLFFWIWNSDKGGVYEWVNSVQVSILVFLDMEFRRQYKRNQSVKRVVSILVFLDMEFRPLSLLLWFQALTCFNPCFSGYGIQTSVAEKERDYTKLFQSLFFWIWNSDLKNHHLET